MNPGDLIDGRFEVIESAGAGGMAEVYRAIDRTSGTTIALKVLSAQAPTLVLRFEREARVLAELDDPCIVRYLAHGRTPAGESYLAMEWLDGEDLARRLKRGTLSVDDTIEVGVRIADGLAAAHARGIIHRDLKPGNLFLVDRELSKARLIDFGIARSEYELMELTATGVLVGTPVYMSPEQALGSKSIDTRADLFALGCVLFRCLTGRPPFVSENAIVLLGRIVLETAPRLRTVRADVPLALESLVADLLQKRPDARPASATEVAERLRACAPLSTSVTQQATNADAPGETRVSIVVVERASLGGNTRATVSADEATELLARSSGQSATASIDGATLSEHARGDVIDTLIANRVAPYTSHIRRIADGSIVAVITEPMPGLEAGTRAARTALLLRELVPDSHMVIVSKRALGDGLREVGALLGRAVEWLQRPARHSAAGALGRTRIRPIRIDENSAGLLDRRFDLASDRDGLVLRGENAATVPFPFLGRPLPLIGRDRECALLLEAMRRIAAGPGPEVWLVRGPAGSGRRRLISEAIERFSHLGHGHDVWFASADPLDRHDVFSTLASLITSAAGVASESNAGARGAMLRARVSRSLDGDDAALVAFGLAECIGAAIARPGPQCELLQPVTALAMWLRASTAQCPAIIVLENLDNADTVSLQALDEALASAAPLRVLVIATCAESEPNPFPRLERAGALRDLPLGLLTADARAQWGAAVSDRGLGVAGVQSAIGASGELPLAIEQSLRNLAASMPFDRAASIQTLVLPRLASLPRPARSVLECLAVRGVATVNTLCSQQHPVWIAPADIAQHVDLLVAREWIEVDNAGRYGSDHALRIRHPLVRAAVYDTMSPEHRAVFHRTCGASLEASRPFASYAVGTHFERGGSPEQALAHYSNAAAGALAAGDVATMFASAEAALRCSPDDRERAALEQLRGDGYLLVGQNAAAESSLRIALECIERVSNSKELPYVASSLALALSRGGRVDQGAALAARAIEAASALGDPGAESRTRTRLAKILAMQSRLEDAEAQARNAIRASAEPRYLVDALATVAMLQLLGGRTSDALASAREAATLLDRRETADSEPLIRLALAESLHATGLIDAARATAELGCERLELRASALRDPVLSASYLANVPENARLRWCQYTYRTR